MTLPPLGPATPTPATAEGFAVAVGRARHRRWQQIGTATCVAILVVASAGLLTSSAAPATDGLASRPDGVRPTISVTPSPSETAEPPRNAAPVAAGTTTTRSTVTRSAPAATPSPRPPRATVTRWTRPGNIVYGEADRLSAPEDCRVPDHDWCGAVVVTDLGTSLQLTIWMCAPASADTKWLNFDSGQEVDAIVGLDDGRRVWQWSKDRTFEKHSHLRRVEPGRCVLWDVWWDDAVVGDYLVQGMVTADEVAGRVYTTSATVGG